MHAPVKTVILILQISAGGLSPFARLHDPAGRRACVELEPRGSACWSEGGWREHLRARTPQAGPWRALARGDGRWDLLDPGPRAWPAPENPPLPSWQARVELWRLRVSDALRSSDLGGVLRSLLLHEVSSEQAGGVLRLLGFVHLLNATGLHLIAALAWNRNAWRALAAALGWSARAGRIAARATGAAWTLGTWALSGGRFGLLRSLWILLLRGAERESGFRWRFWAPLGLWVAAEAAVARCGLGEPGGWIYGLSVAGAIAASRGGGRASHWRMNLGSWAPVAVWEALSSGWTAWATPLLNLACLPLFAWVIYPLAFAAAAAGWDPGLSAAGFLASRAVATLAECALRANTLWRVTPSALAIGLGASALVLAVGHWVRGRAARAGLSLAMAGLLLAIRLAARREGLAFTRAVLLDVGQGDALLAVSESANLLIDSGPERAKDDRHWLESLASRGVFEIDALLVTHLDLDHAGGVDRLAPIARIGCVGVPDAQWGLPRTLAWRRRLQERWGLTAQKASRCSPLPQASLPSGAARGGRRPIANDAMGAYVVPLKPSGALVSFGDADRAQERALLERLEPEIRALGRPVILKASHHGSKTSSDVGAMRRLAPDEVWISCGARNPYGHPHPWALDRISRAAPGVPVRRTDLDGDIEWTGAPQ